MQYKVGTADFRNGVTTISFTGTSLLTNISVGDLVSKRGESASYTIGAVNSDTLVTLTSSYAGVTAVGADYEIISDFTTYNNLSEIWAGDKDWPWHLTNGVIRKLDNLLGGVSTISAICATTITAVRGIITSLTPGYLPKHTSDTVGFDDSLLYQSSYALLWNDTANAKNTYGFTVNQLAADDEIISLKSSDVSQPMTAYTESDTYAYFAKTDANAGGLTIAGFTDATIANGAIQLMGLMGAASPTATHPAIKMNAYKTDGGTGITALGSTDTILSVQNQNTNLFTILGDSTNYHQWSGVAHGMTDLAPTDAYGKIAPINTSNGGLNIFGLSDTNVNPLQIYGVFGTDNPTDTTGAIILGGSKKDGTTHQALAAAETVIHLRNYSTDLLTVLGSGSAILGTSTAVGTSGAKVLMIDSGTAPTTSPADAAQLYVADHNGQAGYARLHERTEDGKSAPIALLSEVNEYKNPLAFAQGIHMTYAASGSSGIIVADNDNLDVGIYDFTYVFQGTIYSSNTILLRKLQDADNYVILSLDASSYLHMFLRAAGTTVIDAVSTTTIPSTSYGTRHEYKARVTRESAGSAGSVVFSIDGVQLGNSVAIPAGAPPSMSNSGTLYVLGTNIIRYNSLANAAHIYNRVLSSTEDLAVFQGGPKSEWFDQRGVSPASQTAQTSGSLVIGKEYRIDTYVSDDNFSNVATVVSGTINTSGCVFIATGTTPTKWTNSSSLRRTGVTLWLPPEGIQPAPGQWLDASGNKLHAWQPATGSSLTRYKKTFEIRGINTWSGTQEAQSMTMTTDASRAMLPVGCYITDIIGSVQGANIEDIIIGDGSDTDRWVTLTSGLAAGTQSFTLANKYSDGTNYEMVVDPDALCTMTIVWTVKGLILE